MKTRDFHPEVQNMQETWLIYKTRLSISFILFSGLLRKFDSCLTPSDTNNSIYTCEHPAIYTSDTGIDKEATNRTATGINIVAVYNL